MEWCDVKIDSYTITSCFIPYMWQQFAHVNKVNNEGNKAKRQHKNCPLWKNYVLGLSATQVSVIDNTRRCC